MATRYDLNDSELSLYEVLGISPPVPAVIRSRRSVSYVPICPEFQVTENLEPEEIDAEPELPTVGLWTVEHVQAFSQFSESWIYKQVELGTLPHIRKGRGIRFEPQAIRDFFLKKQKKQRSR